jgi:hypothetical protein
MKKLLLTALACLPVVVAQAQTAGTAIVWMNNYDRGNAIMYAPGAGAAVPAPAADTLVQVLGGPTASDLVVVRSTDGLSTFQLAEDGYFDGGFGMVTNVTGGTAGFFLVRAWRGAPSWESAITNAAAFTGQSTVFSTGTTSYPGQPAPPDGPGLAMDAITLRPVVVAKLKPLITWNKPAGVTYGTALGSAQLNATATVNSATVTGTFAYTPASNSVPTAGSNTLSVVFTPSNGATYDSATGSVVLVVLKAPLNVAATSASRVVGTTNPVFTGTLTGVTNNDRITATYSCTATTASVAGTYPIVPSLSDPDGRLANYTVTSVNGTLTVTTPALAVTTTALPAGTVGTAYSQTLAASGGTTPYTWTVTTGTLPAGLTLATNGVLSGTPTAYGTNTFTVQAKDALNATATKSLTLGIVPAALQVTTATLPNGTVGAAYSQTLAASGGGTPYTWTVTTGTLPAGLTLATNGVLSGTPTAYGTNTFTVQAKDVLNATATKSLTLGIAPAALQVTTATLPNGTVGAAYSQTLAASGGGTPYTWSVTTGTLPAGLTLATGGVLSGTPTASGTSTFTVQAKDALNTTATKSLTLVINPAGSGVVITLPETLGVAGTEVVVPLQGRQFNRIVGFQFSVHWNPAILSFVGLEQMTLPGLTTGNYNTASAASGQLTVSWEDPETTGKTIADGTAIFGIRFTLVGAPGASDTVRVDGVPTAMEILDSDLNALPFTVEGGIVRVLRTVQLGGTIRYYDPAKVIGGAPVLLSGADAQTNVSASTGQWGFTVNAGSNYVVTPTYPTNALSGTGLSTADLVLIRRHILNLVSLDSPYKVLAADANGSASVTTADLVFLRRVILGITNTLPAGPWRFVRSDYAFTNTMAPWNAETNRVYTAVAGDSTNQDFVAVKVGDVNNSWVPSGSGLAGPPPDPGIPVRMELADVTAKPGDVVEVPVVTHAFEGVTTVQFSLQWDPSKLQLEATSGYGCRGLADGNFNLLKTADGRLACSWDDPETTGVTLADGASFFTMRFRVLGAAGTTASIGFADEPTVREITVQLASAMLAGRNAIVTIGGGVVTPPLVSLALVDGKPELTVTGDAGTVVEIEVSTAADGGWQTQTTLTLGTTGATWMDSAGVSGTTKFYRAKVK